MDTFWNRYHRPIDIGSDMSSSYDNMEKAERNFLDCMYHAKDILESPIFITSYLQYHLKPSTRGFSKYPKEANGNFNSGELELIFKEIEKIVDSKDFSEWFEDEEILGKVKCFFLLADAWNAYLYDRSREFFSYVSIHGNKEIPLNDSLLEYVSFMIIDARKRFPYAWKEGAIGQ